MFLRQSTASQEVLLGPYIDETDGITPLTGLTIANTDIKVWKSGATTLVDKNSGGGTHISAGRYYAVLDATDSNTLGNLEIHSHVSGALPIKREFVVLPAVTYDALVAGTLTEPAAVPAVTANPFTWIAWIGCAFFRNKMTQTGSTQTLHNDAGASIATSTTTDSAGTTTRNEYA